MRLSYGKTILLGLGYFGVSAAWATYGAFVPALLVTRFGLGAAEVGFFMALDNIAALLIQPPVGAWSDRVRSPLGRRLPFILVGAPVAAVFLGLIPVASAFPLFLGCAVAFLLSMAFWRSPFFTLLPDLTPSRFRSQANGIINAIGVTGAMAAFFAGAQLYTLSAMYPFWVGSALLVLTAILLVVFLRGSGAPRGDGEKQAGMVTILHEVVQDRDKSVLRIMFAILLVFISTNGLDAFVTLYSINHLGLTAADGARLMGQFTVAFVLFAIPAGILGAHIGRRRSICWGLAIMTLCSVTQFLLPVPVLVRALGGLPIAGAVPVVGISMMLTGIGWSVVHTNSLPMVVDATTPAHAGAYVGLYYLFSTFGAIIGPITNGWIIQQSGSDYNLMLLVSPVFLLAALSLMLGVRRGEAMVVAPSAA